MSFIVGPPSQSVQAAVTKVPQTGWLITSRNLFVAVAEAGSPGGRCGQIPCLGMARLPGPQTTVSHCALMGCTGALWGPFDKGTEVIHEGSSFIPSQRPLCRSGGSKHSVCGSPCAGAEDPERMIHGLKVGTLPSDSPSRAKRDGDALPTERGFLGKC